jgi:hypothetical protein
VARAQDSITVTGNPDRPDRKEALKALTRGISRLEDADGQLARFNDDLCIVVSGFSGPYNDIVAGRMADDAASAGLHVEKPGCRPNVVLLITDNVSRELRYLGRDGGPAASVGLLDKDLRHLADGPGPAYVVTMTELRSRDGNHLGGGRPPVMIVNDSSIINPPTRHDIVGVLVALESSAAMGKSLRQLADYAALRAMARLKDSTMTMGEPSILTLFQDKAPVAELSAYDRAYLKGLYRGSAAMTGRPRCARSWRRLCAPPRRDPWGRAGG